MTSPRLPPMPGTNLHKWALEMTTFIRANVGDTRVNDPDPVLLPHQMPTRKNSAVTEGVLMYDPTIQRPVYSRDKAWNQLLEAADLPGSIPVEIIEADAPNGWQVWGDVLIQWGAVGGSGIRTVTFPKPFKSTPQVAFSVDGAYVSAGTGTGHRFVNFESGTRSATGFQCFVKNGSNYADSTSTAFWIAVGVAPDDMKKPKTVAAIGDKPLPADLPGALVNDGSGNLSWQQQVFTYTLAYGQKVTIPRADLGFSGGFLHVMSDGGVTFPQISNGGILAADFGSTPASNVVWAGTRFVGLTGNPAIGANPNKLVIGIDTNQVHIVHDDSAFTSLNIHLQMTAGIVA